MVTKNLIFGDNKIGMSTCIGQHQSGVSFFKVPENVLEQEDCQLEDPELLFIFKNIESLDTVISVLQGLREGMEENTKGAIIEQ
jgi:hypothetical protein